LRAGFLGCIAAHCDNYYGGVTDDGVVYAVQTGVLLERLRQLGNGWPERSGAAGVKSVVAAGMRASRG
jgi:hypothetical protein